MATFSKVTQYRNYQLRLDVNEKSVDVEKNTSKVDWALYIVNASSRFNANFTYTATINGIKVANYTGNVNTTDVGYNKPHLLNSGTLTITHDIDGTKTILCSASCSGGGPIGPGECELVDSKGTPYKLTLTKINRKAKIESFMGNDIEDFFYATYTKYQSSWTYKLRLQIPNVRTIKTVDYPTSGAAVSLTSAEKELVYSNISADGTVQIGAVIETWNGTTKIGDSEQLINVCSLNQNLRIKINGEWKRGIPFVRVNGEWKRGIPYIKIDGTWRRSI